MRDRVIRAFGTSLDETNELVNKVAVVGGSSGDPEVTELKDRFPNAEFHFLDIDNPFEDSNFHFLDINESSQLAGFDSFFDIAISSQVIEHIWNHQNYFELVVSLVRPSGLIWLNCPKSNMVHGSPHFYSAGFTATYLSKNLERLNCRILNLGEVGNRRFYLGVHLGRYWQTANENRHPLLRYNFQPGSLQGIAWKFIRDLPSRVILSGVSAANSDNLEYATEAYILAQKSPQ